MPEKTASAAIALIEKAALRHSFRRLSSSFYAVAVAVIAAGLTGRYADMAWGAFIVVGLRAIFVYVQHADYHLTDADYLLLASANVAHDTTWGRQFVHELRTVTFVSLKTLRKLVTDDKKAADRRTRLSSRGVQAMRDSAGDVWDLTTAVEPRYRPSQPARGV